MRDPKVLRRIAEFGGMQLSMTAAELGKLGIVSAEHPDCFLKLRRFS